MTQPKVNIRTLPFYANLEKEEGWYNMVPSLLQNQHNWIIRNGLRASLDNEVYPYFAIGVTLWERAINMAGNGGGFLAIYMLRPILERISLIWAATDEIGFDVSSIIRTYQSDNKKLRMRTTETIVEEASKRDYTINILYSLLSRYFNHLSYWDSLSVQNSQVTQPVYQKRIELIPSLLLYDIGHCFENVIKKHLEEKGKSIPENTAGRNGQYSPLDYMRICHYLFSEKHTKSKGIELRALINGSDIDGSVGITKIWRGGMEMFRYGEPSKKPPMSKLTEFAIMALGPGYNESEVRIHHRKDGTKGERYEFTWPKNYELSSVLVSLVAGNYKSQNLKTIDYSDYVSEFMKLVTPDNPGELFTIGNDKPKIKKTKFGNWLRGSAKWIDNKFG